RCTAGGVASSFRARGAHRESLAAARGVLGIARYGGDRRSQLSGAQGAFIVWQLRLPRVLVGLIVGGTLALVGAVFQALFQNPLATSDTIGTTAGATVGALFALAIDSSRTRSEEH